jgi:hypothetical protein
VGAAHIAGGGVWNIAGCALELVLSTAEPIAFARK